MRRGDTGGGGERRSFFQRSTLAVQESRGRIVNDADQGVPVAVQLGLEDSHRLKSTRGYQIAAHPHRNLYQFNHQQAGPWQSKRDNIERPDCPNLVAYDRLHRY